MTMSAVDFLDQWFETDVLKATMSASGIIGTFLGVRSPGTAYVLLHHYMGEIDGAFRSWGLARGGTGAISNAIADAARGGGVEIRTTARQSNPRRRRRATASCSRTAMRSRGVVASSVDPRTPFSGLSTPICAGRLRRGHQPLQVPRLVGQGESRARRAARLHVAARPRPHLRGAISISPSVDYMERAYDDAKYGRFSGGRTWTS
jgi:phytoene dehydrogenase-like protein